MPENDRRKSFRVMLCDTFIDILAENEDAAKAEATRMVRSGEQEIDIVAWETAESRERMI